MIGEEPRLDLGEPLSQFSKKLLHFSNNKVKCDDFDKQGLLIAIQWGPTASTWIALPLNFIFSLVRPKSQSSATACKVVSVRCKRKTAHQIVKRKFLSRGKTRLFQESKRRLWSLPLLIISLCGALVNFPRWLSYIFPKTLTIFVFPSLSYARFFCLFCSRFGQSEGLAFERRSPKKKSQTANKQLEKSCSITQPLSGD